MTVSKDENYQAWRLVTQEGWTLHKAGDELFPNDHTPEGRKQKVYRRVKAYERFLREQQDLRKRPALPPKQEPRLVHLDDALWASPSLAWLSPP